MLEINDIKTLLNAICNCLHFQEKQKRSMVIKQFDNQCNLQLKTSLGSCNVQGDDLVSVALNLITIWGSYLGAFNIYIDVAELHEAGSEQLKYLKINGGKIFNPCPNPCLLTRDRDEWIIKINDDELYRIPTSISIRLDDNNLLSATEFRPTWKNIHTLCDNFLTNYIPIYNHIISGNAKNALEKLQSFERDCEDFYTGLESLTHREVFSPEFEPIFHLKIIRNCTMPLKETISNGEGTPYFKLGQEFAHYILIKLVLQSLSMADRILSRSIT
jgi:hypothetical protein